MINKELQVEDIIGLSPIQRETLRKITTAVRQAQQYGWRVYRILGALDVSRLQQAWAQMVACSTVLRSSIHWEGLEKPVRVVRKGQQLTFSCSDWRHVPASGQRGRILQELRAQERESVGVESALPVKIMLAEVGANEYVLICMFNRLLLDEWSLDLIVQDLFQLYQGAGSSSTNSTATDHFKDYLNWANANASASEEYWRDYLCNGKDVGLTERLPHVPGADEERHIEAADLVADDPALQFLKQHGQASFRAAVCGAWAFLLRSHLGCEEAVFGVSSNGRETGFAHADQITGPLAVVLPFHTKIPDQMPVADWLRRLENQWQEIVRHAHIIPESVVPGEKSLFDTAILFSNRPFELTSQGVAGQLAVQEIPLPTTMHSPLALTVRIGRGVAFEMSSDSCFEPRVLQRLLSHFIYILDALTSTAKENCAAIPVMPKGEHDQLLQWSDGGALPSLPESIHTAFEARVKENPERVAAISANESATYGDLNRRANQLAAYLRKSGVGPEVVVGVFMERCMETLVAVLAISKAGGVYLPLDPELPQERISFLLRDASPRVLLTRQSLVSDLPLEAAASEIFSLDGDQESLQLLSTEDHESSSIPESAAYIIYTSGSTGQPKGVVISQRAAVTHLLTVGKTFGYEPEDRMLQFAALSFDVSVEQLLAPLLYGASVMLKDGASWNKSDFFSAIKKFGITVANVPPAFWIHLMEEEEEDLLQDSSLRLMIVGGDILPPATLIQWQQGPMKSIQLLNAYGPTEAVITAMLFNVLPGLADDSRVHRVPVGRPLAGRRAYVLTQEEHAPIQMWGELHLGGQILARGYLNRADLTAEKFLPDPFSEKPGARIYQTGDIGRYLDNGQIDFLGRIDNQVKIRGFRIELGEIEHALTEHPDVLQNVVLARELQEGDRRLVAYVVNRPEARRSASELRSFLERCLPEYMVPASIEFLTSLPLTPAGKVDRRALPLHGEPTETAEAAGPVVDATPTELALMQIWSDVLGVKQMNVNDDFFDLGGDSLLATQIVSRIQKRFGVEVPLRVMFDSPTITALVREIEERGGTVTRDSVPEMVRVADDHEHLLSPAQERLWFVCREMGQSSAYNMTGAIEFEGELKPDLLEETLSILVRRHEALRTTFPLSADHPVQSILPPSPVTLSITDLTDMPEMLREAEVWRSLDYESELPLDLLRGPVFRARLLRLSSRRHVLLATIHHIAGDGWSLGILAQEISMVYGALVQGKSAPLPELPFRYVDFSAWQRQLLDLRRQSDVDFWTHRLSGCPPPLALPQEKPLDANEVRHGANHSLHLQQDISQGLVKLAHDQNATLFMVLLACWKALLSFYTATDDVVVGTDIANRNRPETERIIGFFVNVLVLRSDVGGNPSFLELLERVRETTLAAYQHQDFPFNHVLEILGPGRNSGSRALFKTFFHLLTGKLEVPQTPGMQITILEPDDRAAKFDLSLRVSETVDGVVCRFNYSTSRFDEDAVRQIAQDYQRLVEQVVENPAIPLSALKIMVEAGAIATETNDQNSTSFRRFMAVNSRS